MNNIQKRFFLFLFGCILTRFIFVYIAKNIDKKNLAYMGYIFLIPAIGFLYIYINNLRKTGLEVFGDKIWWNDLRPIHAFLYLLFSYYAINEYKNAYIFLLVDVIIGLLSFLIYHYKEKNINKLSNF
tara:strand:+ start:148 stop:528 length:381 start_codon:yes stop_codon:yes gene_type:complete